jgi:hypothetical protein
VRELFGLDASRWDIDELAKRVLRLESRVYHLDYVNDQVESRDITALDLDSSSPGERSWGGLMTLSAQANAAVANTPEASRE